MTRFEPVHLPEDRKLNGRVSQTFLKHYSLCPRSAFLYATFKGEASTKEMQRGKAGHLVHERAVQTMIEQGEAIIPPELVKAITNEVLAEIAVPVEEHDVIREAAYRLGTEMAIDPRAVVACETLFVLDVGGYEVRCRVDFAQLLDEGTVLVVEDLKFSRAAPAWEEIARKRPDGSLATKSLQLILYGLALVFGVPVREEELAPCPCGEPNGGPPCTVERPCGYAEGRPPEQWQPERVEIREPFPVASRAQRLDLSYVFPAIEDRDGKILRRPMSLTRAELDEYRESFEGLLARLARSEETGDWPAVVSDEACGICPAASLCPIPAELRDHRGTVNTPEQAAEAAEVLYREKAEHRARQAELRAFAKAHGPIRFGGMVFELVPGESEEIRDRDAMWSAMDRAVRYGEPFDRGDFVRVKHRTDFKARDLRADELGESEGSNGGAGHEGAGVADLDERFGKDAP